ncbi:PucR family transcriptional regulator [Glutamicibacter soli]|uniref:PucR family transcriptional regulator n=1 Tax=Glutamicibacter soli TaxID=453836 RepID=A0A365YDS0_9MICC|nr:PucR family transcriptional regulator [Glutamicibacter soli]RBM00537.1 PucR family transcriptional regulator [Glutamicibacter soli]
MAISLRGLLDHDELGLKALTDPTHSLETAITWGAVTELLDPSKFLTGREIVLTTGVRQKSAAAQIDFVRTLAANDVVALGFGIGLEHESVPGPVLETAREVGLPVIEVPYKTPFAAISRLIAEALNADHVKRVENLLRAHQKLAQSLLSSDLDRMLTELSKMLSTDVALSLHGEVISGDFDPGRAWHELPVATGLRDRCTLHIAEPYTRDPIVEYAQSLIGLELTNKSRLRASRRLANGQVLADLASGALSGSDAAVRLGALGLESQREHSVVLVQASGQADRLQTLPLPADLASQVTAIVEDRLVVIVAYKQVQLSIDRLDTYLATAGIPAKVGYGGRYSNTTGIRWSYFEALESLRHGERVNVPTKLSLTSLLLAARDVPLQDLAAEALGPIQDFDSSHDSGLMRTLREYLNRDGSVGAVAESMGLHRNTVRYRMQQIAELSGYDPNVTSDRVQLWIALSALELR